MKGNRRPRRASVVLGALILTLTSQTPAPARPDAAAAVRESRLPPALAAFLQEAEQGFDTANLWMAQIARPRHKGYAWSVTAFKEGRAARTDLSIWFARSTAEGTQRQTSTFGWRLPKGALKMDRDLKPSSLATGRGMGRSGRVSMKLSGPSQFARLRDPEGCTGSISYRIGWFAGTFRFDARDGHFGKIAFRRAQVALYRAENLRCERPPATPSCPGHLSLSAVDEENGVAVGVFETTEGKVDQTVVVVGSSGNARTAHRISVTVATPEAFEASGDLTTASVDGDVAGPLLSGDLDYLAPPPAATSTDDCGAYESTSGLVTGDYTAHFDSIGAVTPASTGLAATLRREGT